MLLRNVPTLRLKESVVLLKRRNPLVVNAEQDVMVTVNNIVKQRKEDTLLYTIIKRATEVNLSLRNLAQNILVVHLPSAVDTRKQKSIKLIFSKKS